MPAEEQDIARLLQEIQVSQQRARADIQWLLHNQASLDWRLGRLEDSVIFRSLRAIGRAYSQRFWRRPASAARSFAAWREKGGGTLPVPTPSTQPRFTLLVEAVDRERILKSVESYGNCEVIAAAWAEGVARATGDYVAAIGSSGEIYTGALEHFAAASPADLLYSDQETLDEQGGPRQPLFKPDWSPVLLRSVNYLGGFTAMRRELLSGQPDLLSAIRAQPHLKVVHVPAIFYGSPHHTLPAPPVTKAPTAKETLVSIIVCTRTAHLLQNCLSGIRARTDYAAYELIVVQHLGSSNPKEEAAVAQAIASHGAKRVPYAAAFNFSAMNNMGAASATGQVLLFLNDDVDPLQPDWLNRLAAWLEDPTVGAAGAKLTFPDGTLQHSGIAAWRIEGAWHPGRSVPPNENWPWTQYTREVSAVTGACLAVRNEDFRRLGGFDPAFPVNFNDVDLCFRLRRAGFTIIVDVEAELRHDESRTRARGTTYEERRIFFGKWAAELERTDPFYTPHLVQNNENLSLR